jgi:UDP-N-acetylmuramyl pentapeptide phosphotransferase/UDP-N-acetylglucosamine-1-phosphate transferase
MTGATIQNLLIFFIALLASWAGVGLFRRWSINRQLLDIPNERSSHTIPTPRGGGLVIALLGLLGYLAIHFFFGVPFSPGYFFGALLIAGVSWLDDLYSLPFWTRLIVHIGAAVVLIADAGIWQEMSLLVSPAGIQLGPILGRVLTACWIVWLVNAYNFMDGIDGIAALYAAVAGAGWAMVALTYDLTGLFLFAGIVASVSLGFLLHNWQPARIFMGDVGSAYLGFTLAAMPLLARFELHDQNAMLPTIAILFVWFFLFDTIFTFLRRAVNRERVWEAHRTHLYQLMVIGGRSHKQVALLYGTAASILAASVLAALNFAGNYALLTVLLLVILTTGQVWLAFLKKR